MLKKRKCCCRKRTGGGVGYFLIAIGVGLFLAYIIPRYILITLLGLGFICIGVCFITNK